MLGPVPGVRTALPGPRSRQLLDRQAARESNARSYPRRLPIAIKRGQGAFLQDEDDNVFIDFLNAAGALALGHGHAELVAAVQRQVAELTQALDFPTAAKDEFTTKLLGILPEGMRSRARVHFCGPTGANAVEAAVKLCKTATGRGEIVAFQGGFHGMTHAAMALSGESAIRASVPNVMPGVTFFPFAYCHRCPLGLRRDSCSTNCADYLERALHDTHSGMTRPAAVLLEIVQGEGGTVVAPVDFVRRVREVTTRLDIPLVVDEVQTGFGRTGRWFAFEHYGIEPDVVVLSKMMSGIGMPVAAVVYDERLDVWRPGSHTGTFRGNQVAFAAGSTFIDVMCRDEILANVRLRGQQLADRLDLLRREHEGFISDVRCLGLLVGVELGRPDGGPWPEAAALVRREALRRGLILETGGRHDGVVRMLPPLNLDETTADTAMDIFAQAVAAAGTALRSGPGQAP
ncbi:MAG TPA: diaminobutyrate--2-oxoglutarate transaminase family protein [Micromonosporaceae bacterium]|nr:diaminobutyrate--2-oxoglutarate transaminase family protein [Micromonosporaceae bacterium]